MYIKYLIKMKRVVLNFKEWFGNLVLDYIDFYWFYYVVINGFLVNINFML